MLALFAIVANICVGFTDSLTSGKLLPANSSLEVAFVV